jgi:magnesium transporter
LDNPGVSTERLAEPPVGRPLLPGSVEEHLVTAVPVCSRDDLAGPVRQALAGRSYACADDVAVCDGEAPDRRLVGVIPVERLLGAGDDEVAGDLMDPDPPVVAPGLDQEQAAWKAVQHGEATLAVVDAEGAFRGFVAPSRLLGAVLRSYDDDFARLGGYLASTASARHAIEEPLRSRLWHRLPWLLVGLLGSALSAGLVRGFEGQIAQDVRLAFFVPGVVYMADAVGTQTEALVIRGLSVGASMRTALRLESFTGVAMGLLLGLVTFPTVWLVLGSVDLALAVAIALFAACSVATVVAMGLPWLMHRSGRDPAYGSGPLSTVVQDLLSLLIYLWVASVLVG